MFNSIIDKYFHFESETNFDWSTLPEDDLDEEFQQAFLGVVQPHLDFVVLGSGRDRGDQQFLTVREVLQVQT